jgi:hypothetical protein
LPNDDIEGDLQLSIKISAQWENARGDRQPWIDERNDKRVVGGVTYSWNIVYAKFRSTAVLYTEPQYEQKYEGIEGSTGGGRILRF